MAKRKPDARRDAENFKDLIDIYRDGDDVAAIMLLDDGKTTGVLSAGNGAKILSLLTRGTADLLHQMANNDRSAIELAEKIGALIPARVLELCGDRSLLDALHATIRHGDD